MHVFVCGSSVCARDKQTKSFDILRGRELKALAQKLAHRLQVYI